MIDDRRAWIGIPLVQGDKTVGLVLLCAPEYRRPLDWEDFDLLRTAAVQAASAIAEAQSQRALVNAQRFEEFNRRFAFILHDIKNLVSQLSLVTRNAERHAENAEFRADMIATLKSSIAKMTELLARLSPHSAARPKRVQPQPVRDVVAAAVAPLAARHEVRISGAPAIWAQADSAALEQAVRHLVHNAIEASPCDAPVEVRIEARGTEAAIVVRDRGCGMDADFIRDQLFQPFASTKPSGFGIGAFEANSLAAAMGGRISVESRPGEGSSFTIHLPAAQSPPAEYRKIA
jgi:putative PEP-CTERM system histidine kinase